MATTGFLYHFSLWIIVGGSKRFGTVTNHRGPSQLSIVTIKGAGKKARSEKKDKIHVFLNFRGD
jgi:hypothetical protein